MLLSGVHVRACLLGAALGSTATVAVPRLHPHLFRRAPAAAHRVVPAALPQAVSAATGCVPAVLGARAGAASRSPLNASPLNTSSLNVPALTASPLPDAYTAAGIPDADLPTIRPAKGPLDRSPIGPQTTLIATTTPVPEPMSIALLVGGVGGLAVVRVLAHRHKPR